MLAGYRRYHHCDLPSRGYAHTQDHQRPMHRSPLAQSCSPRWPGSPAHLRAAVLPSCPAPGRPGSATRLDPASEDLLQVDPARLRDGRRGQGVLLQRSPLINLVDV